MSYETNPGSLAGQPQQILTHSRMSCYRDCPRKHYISYELGIKSDSDSEAIRFGHAFHEAIEHESCDDVTSRMEDRFMAESVKATFAEYVNRYPAHDDVQQVANELEFEIPIINPATGRPTPTFVLKGKIDNIVQLHDGRLALMENKTTTRDFSPGADYWTRLHMDMQLSIYLIAARSISIEVDTILYNVIRRSALRPLKATPPESRKFKKDGTLYANQRAEDETPQEYGQRIREDIQSRPDYYFARIEIARLQDDLDECAAEIWQQQLAIREAQKSGLWYRNPNNCFGFFKCQYLPICQNRDLETHTPAGFIRLDEIHPELSVEFRTGEESG
jgi:hypothetical protein